MFPEAVIEATPVRLPLTFPAPLKLCPQIVREVCKVVAVVALPLREPVSVPDSPPLNVALPAKVLVELRFVSNW